MNQAATSCVPFWERDRPLPDVRLAVPNLQPLPELLFRESMTADIRGRDVPLQEPKLLPE